MRCIAASSCAPQSQRIECKHVAGQARRVHAHEHVLAVADVAADQRDVRLVVDLVLERVHAEVAVVGRQLRRRDALDERLGAHPVLDQIGDR